MGKQPVFTPEFTAEMHEAFKLMGAIQPPDETPALGSGSDDEPVDAEIVVEGVVVDAPA